MAQKWLVVLVVFVALVSSAQAKPLFSSSAPQPSIVLPPPFPPPFPPPNKRFLRQAWHAPLSVSSGTWYPTPAPSRTWFAIDCSADGRKVVAAALFDTIYRSPDSGATWVQTGAPTNSYWTSVACSADGNRIIASEEFNVWLSTNAGASWDINDPTNVPGWSQVRSSADGSVLLALTVLGWLYISTDSGGAWAQISPPLTFPSEGLAQIALSADGHTIVAASGIEGYVYVSHDQGTTWMQAEMPLGVWNGVGVSADGNKMVALRSLNIGPPELQPPPLNVSSDGGNSWTAVSAPSYFWGLVGMSADGETIVTATGRIANSVYRTSNGGKSWHFDQVPYGNGWSDFAISANGRRMFLTDFFGHIYCQ